MAKERGRNAQADLEKTLGRAGIPRRFINRSFDGYQTSTDEQHSALEICQIYAAEFSAMRDEGNCLILSGSPGTGKTHLACAILTAVVRQGYTGLFLTISEALRLIRDTYSPSASCTESEAFAALTSPDLLVLDEVGVAIGDAHKRQALLFDVLNTRYANQRPTVLIGNLTEAEIADYLGTRIMDRIMETGSALVPFTWASYRRRGKDAARNPASQRQRGA